MQALNGTNQRAQEEPVDGRRDSERGSSQDAPALAPQLPADSTHRTVCMSAGLTGRGGVVG